MQQNTNRSESVRASQTSGDLDVEIRGPNSVGGIQPVGPTEGRSAGTENKVTAEQQTDQASFTQVAMLRSKLMSVPDIRTDKVQAIREAIESGVYDTAGKIDTVVDKLLGEG